MSDLLNSASLVLIPSGYKEDIVYSAVPTDGSGDLSFTRASNGTRINSAGLVEVCPWNLVEQSETFSSAVWNRYQSTITTNTTTAPNGTLSADSLIDNTGNDVHIVYQGIAGIVAGTYTISVYAKASTLSHINLQLYDNAGTFYTSNAFNLSNGTTTGANQSIESVGNGWYRCIFTFITTVSGTQYIYVMLNNGTSNFYVGTGSGTVFIWGAQLNIGSTAKPYFPTTDRLNVPRLTYQNGGGGCPSLLLEKQSTNLVTYSEEFDNVLWTKNQSTISSNAATSPEGNMTGDKLVEDASNNTHDINRLPFNATGGQTYSFSIFVKTDTRSKIRIGYGALVNFDAFGGDVFALIDVSNKSVISSTLSPSVSFEDFENGYVRVTFLKLAAGTGQFNLIFGLVNSSNQFSYLGDGTSGLFIWGAQLEQSSYPTSYIPTTSASATRVADACSKTGISSLIGQTEGTMFWEGKGNATVGGQDLWMAQISVNDSNVAILIYYVASLQTVNAFIYNGTTSVVLDASMNLSQVNKVAVGYKNGDFVLYLNGSLVDSSTSATAPPTGMNQFALNKWVGASNQEVAIINQAVLFKTRLTNSELASLTTI